MGPLAKLWTWTGQSFVPLAVGWAVFVRGGIDGETPTLGVLVSRGYWGLLVTLAAAAVLIWSCALYVRSAKRKGAGIFVPPNTTFEDSETRNQLISWGTVVIFALAILAGLAVFGVRYTDSKIHGWNDVRPIRKEFLESRIEAHRRGCSNQPCFAVESRFDGLGKPVSGVNEYVLYVTDGALLVLAVPVLLGLGYIVVIGFQKPRIPHFDL